MSITLIEAARANFRASKAGDAINTAMMGRLGVAKRLLPARLAIARSLAIPGQPAPIPGKHGTGNTIKGDILFGTGTELSTWLSLIIEHSGRDDMNIKELIALVAAHWDRGLQHHEKDWELSGQDRSAFIRRLVDEAELPSTATTAKQVGDAPAFASEMTLPIGEVSREIGSNKQVSWGMNAPGGSPHCAIMGGVGSGKTRTAVAIIRAIREKSKVPVIAFDFKGDLVSGYGIEKLLDAEVVAPPRIPVPLDVLTLSSGDEFDVAQAAARFRDSFGLLNQRLGTRQKAAVLEAANRALANTPCELRHVRDSLADVYEEQDMNPDGATSTMSEICQFPLFAPDQQSPDFFQKSWVIQLLPEIGDESRNIVTNLILDALDRYISSLPDSPVEGGFRSLRMFCLVDEAHRILGKKLPGLSNLVRMSRSKGGAIMLVSQSPDDFAGIEDNFLDEMGLVVAFGTNAKPAAVKRILGKGSNLSALSTGECFAKQRGEQAARKLLAWE